MSEIGLPNRIRLWGYGDIPEIAYFSAKTR